MKTLRLSFLFGVLALLLTSTRAQGFYDQLIAEAKQNAPSEVQLHIITSKGRLSNFIGKVRSAKKIPGWQCIRVKGDAAFAFWDSYHKDYVWRGGKFTVIYEITTSQELKLSEVTFNGTTTKAD
jgi:hypothetical protein